MSVEKFVEVFKLKLPREHWSKIRILDATSGLYCYEEPIEHDEMQGFFYIPEFEDHVVSLSGVVIDLRRNRVKTWSVWKDPKGVKRGGYRVTAAINNVGDKKRFTRHRAVASAFIPYTLRDKKMLVNHKNGVPGDDRVENLEWCTYSENNQHAYDQKLYKDGKTNPVIHRNRNTGEETRYSTVRDCSNALGIGYAIVNDRSQKPHLEFDDGHDFKRDDGLPWPTERKSVKTPVLRTVCSRNIETGVITIYQHAKAASIATGVLKGTIDFHCNMETIVPSNGFNFRYLEQGMSFPVHSELSLNYFRANPTNAKGLGYIVSLKDGTEVGTYYSLGDAANVFGKSPERTRQYLNGVSEHPVFNIRSFDPKTNYTLIGVMPH